MWRVHIGHVLDPTSVTPSSNETLQLSTSAFQELLAKGWLGRVYAQLDTGFLSRYDIDRTIGPINSGGIPPFNYWAPQAINVLRGRQREEFCNPEAPINPAWNKRQHCIRFVVQFVLQGQRSGLLRHIPDLATQVKVACRLLVWFFEMRLYHRMELQNRIPHSASEARNWRRVLNHASLGLDRSDATSTTHETTEEASQTSLEAANRNETKARREVVFASYGLTLEYEASCVLMLKHPIANHLQKYLIDPKLLRKDIRPWMPTRRPGVPGSERGAGKSRARMDALTLGGHVPPLHGLTADDDMTRHLDASHLCHQGKCFNLHHVAKEPTNVNLGRNHCQTLAKSMRAADKPVPRYCPNPYHHPPCFLLVSQLLSLLEILADRIIILRP